MKQVFIFSYFFLTSILLSAEDGSRLWLRYEQLPENIATNYSDRIRYISVVNSETGKVIRKEFCEAFEAMTGKQLYPPVIQRKTGNLCFEIDKQIEKGYAIQHKTTKGGTYISVSARDDRNLLYGMFHLLRLMQTQADISQLNIREIPRYERRILNHWDNLDRTVERGYAGHSLWQWDELPQALSPRYEAYALANASIGINGTVLNNVIIQIKNGPVDFQPREPFSPLFGALRHTQEMLEFQITQEYLGFSNHLVYLAPLFEETLDSDTYSDGQGSTIAKITDGTLRTAKVTAISGVTNIGEDANWCGHPFAQANWYAFGRLAWNSELTSEQIAGEWLKMTFTSNPEFIVPVKEMMLSSRETCVDYMMPLGLHHIFAFNHHYGPEPWGDMPGGRPDWMPWYYHNADSVGLGFDRTVAGSNAVSQYFPPLNEIYNDRSRCPENLLLWFHHVPWGYAMQNGRSLWDNLCYRYERHK